MRSGTPKQDAIIDGLLCGFVLTGIHDAGLTKITIFFGLLFGAMFVHDLYRIWKERGK